MVAATRYVSITVACIEFAAFTGDEELIREELIRRMIVNVLDNEQQHVQCLPPATTAPRRDRPSVRFERMVPFLLVLLYS